jgi:hypothetical protein
MKVKVRGNPVLRVNGRPAAARIEQGYLLIP